MKCRTKLGKCLGRRVAARAFVLYKCDLSHFLASLPALRTDLADVALKTVLLPAAVEPLIAALAKSGAVVLAGRGGRVFDSQAFARVRKKVLDAVAGLHRKDPALPVLPLSSVRAALGRMEPSCLEAAIEELVKTGDLKRSPEGGIFWKGHSVQVPAQEAERCAKILAALEKGAGAPPDEADLQATLNLPPQQVKKTLLLLEARREVFRAGPLWFHGGWVETAKARLAAHVREKGPFTASEARNLLVTSRKYIIPLLEALDEKGFTKRTGDTRVLR